MKTKRDLLRREFGKALHKTYKVPVKTEACESYVRKEAKKSKLNIEIVRVNGVLFINPPARKPFAKRVASFFKGFDVAQPELVDQF